MLEVTITESIEYPLFVMYIFENAKYFINILNRINTVAHYYRKIIPISAFFQSDDELSLIHI